MSDNKGTTALDWWRDELRAETGAARAFRARLRRASSAAEVLSEEAVFRLAQSLSLTDPMRLALIAQVLATVKEHNGVPLARRLGQGEPPALSPLRFQRLLRATDPIDLTRALRRALPMAEAGCDVADLGRDLFWWNESVRIRWCFQYFGAREIPSGQSRERAGA